ncbi:MAG: putative metal-dependent hydrolase [bacterium]|nr:putative metal-dependent hydrolase [bacterium]
MEELKYPIGKFQFGGISAVERKERVEAIRNLPSELNQAIAGLTEQQLDTPYREGGWTVRIVVHHIADASIVFYTRSKTALTEDVPGTVGFSDQEWVKLADSKGAPKSSLLMLEGLHVRWSAILDAMKPEDFERKYTHFARGEEAVDFLLAYAAWHGKHHTAHITQLRKRMGW